MNKTLIGAALIAAVAVPAVTSAHTNLSIGLGLGGPVYAPPAVVYAPPPPVYVAPPPVVYEQPAYVYGPPVVYGPEVEYRGYYGPHYYRPYGYR